MKMIIKGDVVDVDRFEWNFNNRTGVAYSVLLREDGARPGDAAARVKITAEQYGHFQAQKGKHVELPVDVFANTQEKQGVITGAKLSVSCDGAYGANSTGKPLHAAASA